MLTHLSCQMRPLLAYIYCWNRLQVTLSVAIWRRRLLVLVARSLAAGLRNRQVADWHPGSAGTVITALCLAAASS
jgi:hypothetical protein